MTGMMARNCIDVWMRQASAIVSTVLIWTCIISDWWMRVLVALSTFPLLIKSHSYWWTHKDRLRRINTTSGSERRVVLRWIRDRVDTVGWRVKSTRVILLLAVALVSIVLYIRRIRCLF